MQAHATEFDYTQLMRERNGSLTVAVISDSHIPFRLAAMPDEVFAHCASAQLILHAGDLEDVQLISRLQRIAPTHAVRGNIHWTYAYGIHDMDLPAAITVHAGLHQIWLTHGDLNFAYTLLDKLIIAARKALGQRRSKYTANARISMRLRARKPQGANIVIFGHTHFPNNERMDNTLYFNAGAIVGADRGLAEPSMGLLNLFEDGRIEARHIPLSFKK